jgi:hypothetical protein
MVGLDRATLTTSIIGLAATGDVVSASEQNTIRSPRKKCASRRPQSQETPRIARFNTPED